MLLLILLASAVDYPARTPMIMATIVLSALWLSWAAFSGRARFTDIDAAPIAA
ncbi:hypothetical protein PIB19_22445 [Sphingomonas sp. 7/4-4]|uniref:hypothetical protein n=1 Tax=Sphingomonas sp. 7/4-4 TaxID=3018446 RepID=UPI0022F38F53|nr:hypothetical protein [Sphingomonas sp. 7/4-4]WBY07966.1 hypothetical protein PIB19_22445 [Sphingomonas sp. 7/4-4]